MIKVDQRFNIIGRINDRFFRKRLLKVESFRVVPVVRVCAELQVLKQVFERVGSPSVLEAQLLEPNAPRLEDWRAKILILDDIFGQARVKDVPQHYACRINGLGVFFCFMQDFDYVRVF